MPVPARTRLGLVLDTNVWLDWLVFDDPSVAPLKAAVEANRAEIFIDAACEAELERALGYDLGKKFTVDAQQGACLAECRRLARRIDCPRRNWSARACRLPRPRRSEVHGGRPARAAFLVTKDRALLDSRRASRFSYPGAGGVEKQILPGLRMTVRLRSMTARAFRKPRAAPLRR
jgi:predicted nucleic acid-binding protein